MTSTAISIHQAIDLVEEAILGNDFQLMQTSLGLLANAKMEAIATNQFYLVEVASGRLRDNFKDLSILPRTKSGQLSEQVLALLLEHTAPTPHLIWNTDVSIMSESLITMLIENHFKFWPRDYKSQFTLAQLFRKQENQNLKALVFEGQLLGCSLVDRSKYDETPVRFLDMIFNEKIRDLDHGTLSEPIVEVIFRNREAFIGEVIKDIAIQRLPRESNLWSYIPPLRFSVVQQLHSLGMTELAPTMYPVILAAQDNPRQFTQAEKMGVVIEKDLLKTLINLSERPHYSLPAMVYALESPSISTNEFASTLATYSPKSNMAMETSWQAQFNNVVPALKAVYEKSGKHKNPQVHEKTHALLSWLTKKNVDLDTVRSGILNIKKIPKEIFEKYPTFLEERFSRDIGL
jgi:hypothetical protein